MERWHFCDGLRYHSHQQNVAITVLWHSWVPINLDGDKSRVFYYQCFSKSKTVSTKWNNLHVDSKLPQQLHVALHCDQLLHLGQVQWGLLEGHAEQCSVFSEHPLALWARSDVAGTAKTIPARLESKGNCCWWTFHHSSKSMLLSASANNS